MPKQKIYADREYVNTQITNLVNSAPETLDTLGELATALQQNNDVVEVLNEAIGGKANKSELKHLAFADTVVKTDLESSVQASLDKADTALQSFEETDPTVPAWAKAETKPAYTASEVGAAPTEHSQSASTITVGTFAGEVIANASAQTPTTSLIRNSKLVSAETNPTNNGEIFWTYE